MIGGWNSDSRGQERTNYAHPAWAPWSLMGASLVKSKAVIQNDNGRVLKWSRVPVQQVQGFANYLGLTS